MDPSVGDATGTARVYHANVNYPDLTAWADVRVDCVVTGGRTATVTGVVTDASPTVRTDWIDRRIGLHSGGFTVRGVELFPI